MKKGMDFNKQTNTWGTDPSQEWRPQSSCPHPALHTKHSPSSHGCPKSHTDMGSLFVTKGNPPHPSGPRMCPPVLEKFIFTLHCLLPENMECFCSQGLQAPRICTQSCSPHLPVPQRWTSLRDHRYQKCHLSVYKCSDDPKWHWLGTDNWGLELFT